MQRNTNSLRRKAKRTYFIERVREREDMVGRLSRRSHALFASLGAAAISRTHRSRRGLGVVAAFTLCLLLHFRARLLALPRSHHNFAILTSKQ